MDKKLKSQNKQKNKHICSILVNPSPQKYAPLKITTFTVVYLFCWYVNKNNQSAKKQIDNTERGWHYR